MKTITHNWCAYPNQRCLAGSVECRLGGSLNFNEFIRNFPEVPLTTFFSCQLQLQLVFNCSFNTINIPKKVNITQRVLVRPKTETCPKIRTFTLQEFFIFILRSLMESDYRSFEGCIARTFICLTRFSIFLLYFYFIKILLYNVIASGNVLNVCYEHKNIATTIRWMDIIEYIHQSTARSSQCARIEKTWS